MNSNLLDKVYPVGSIYLSTKSTNPSTLFGGTWVSWGAGKFLVGINSSDSNFNTVEKTGGSKTHQHRLPIAVDSGNWTYMHWNNAFRYGSEYITSPNRNKLNNSAENVAMRLEQLKDQLTSHLPPYITCYMWKRTA